VIFMKKSDSFIVTVDDTGEYNVVDRMELDRHALKAQVDYDGSKQVVDEQFKAGVHVLEPRYNPYDLVQLLDLYTYHAACVDAVAVDSTGIDYTLKPVEDVEPIDAEKERFITVLENCKPSINNNLQKMVFDRRAIGYGALELIRETTSDSEPVKLKHIPAQTIRRHADTKRVVHTTPAGERVWYVIDGKNYDDYGNKVDVHADTGAFHPFNSLAPHERANELLWTMEYAPGTDYYGRPPIISALGSIKGDVSAVKYNYSFFDNYGMPKFAITVTGDFADYDVDPSDEDYDYTQTLKYKISQQIKEVIKNPHSAICITIPSEGEEGNVDLKITPLSVQTEEGHFRLYRKDTRDEVIHCHGVDPSRLGIYDAGSLNGGNSDNTMASYKYGKIAPIKAEIEDLVNLIGEELEVTSWKFCIEDVAPIDYNKDIVLADFLFARGAMTIKELIDNFGSKFGLTIDEIENQDYLNARYLNNVPLEQIWNSEESNPYLEEETILESWNKAVTGGNVEKPRDEEEVVDSPAK
jgi:PBSX family phage portal protein